MTNQIEIGYDKRFLKEKRKCPSIDEDFKRFEKALKVDLKDNNYKIPLNTKKYSKISGLDKEVILPAFVAKVFYCEKMNRESKSCLEFPSYMMLVNIIFILLNSILSKRMK